MLRELLKRGNGCEFDRHDRRAQSLAEKTTVTTAKVMSVCARWMAAAAVLTSLWLASGADAQTFFYTEVAKDGRIYVFAISSIYDAFT